MISGNDFQSYMGPGDKNLPNSEISGYQPVSRIGEVVMNAFSEFACPRASRRPPPPSTRLMLSVAVVVSTVDSYEFSALKENQLNEKQMSTFETTHDDYKSGAAIEFKPHFHEWATVQPGMVCLARKKKTAVFRQYIAAETAVPVIACAACLPKIDEKNYFFAGIARSKSVRTPDDGIGPSVDEFFTVSIGGMSTILNTSGGPIYPGDLIEWALATSTGTSKTQRSKAGPRRVAISVASVSSPKIIGRALSFAKMGETLDILLKM